MHTVQQQPIVAPFSESRCRQISFRNCRFPSGALADRLSQGHANQFHLQEVDFSHEPSLPSKSWLNPLSCTAATNGSFGLPPAVVAEHRWGVPDRPKPLQERMPKQYIYMPSCMCVSYKQIYYIILPYITIITIHTPEKKQTAAPPCVSHIRSLRSTKRGCRK